MPLTRLGVLGWPVRHSLSPRMHNAALRELGLGDTWRYQHLPVPPERFAETVRALPALGFRGANVTIPHKQAALAVADEATETAARIGAANTLTFAGGAIHADNTDAPGFLAALGRDPRGATALVLGAGGSARAVIDALVSSEAADVAVWNRTPERAREVCAQLGGRPVETDEATALRPQILVNCTSVGLATPGATLKQLPLAADSFGVGTLVVDLVYRNGGTALTQAAQAAGATVVDGLEILVAQGAASLQRWTGMAPPLQTMREAVAG